MADIFTLMGKISIDCTEAEKKLDSLISKADTLNGKLGGTKTAGAGSAGTTNTGGSANTTVIQTTQPSSITQQEVAKGTAQGNIVSGIIKDVGNLLLGGVKTGLSRSSMFETSVASFQTKLKMTKEEAEGFANSLVEFAKDTPLSLEAVFESADQLLSTGISADEVVPMLTVIGNNINGDNSRMYRATKFVTDVKGYDQLHAQEKRQGVEAGIYADKLVEEYLRAEYLNGISTPEEWFKTRNFFGEMLDDEGIATLPYTGSEGMEANKEKLLSVLKEYGINYDILWKSLVHAQEHGSFKDAMKNQMNTYSGVGEKYSDAYAGAMSTAVEEFGLKSVIKGLKSFGTFFWDGIAENLEKDGAFSLKYWGRFLQKGWRGVTYPFAHGSESFTEDEWEEELRQRYEDAGKLPEVYGPPLPPDWTPAGNKRNTEDVATSIRNAIAESLPGAVSSGFSNANITVTVNQGNVRLDSGALVGQLAPHVNVALGAMGTAAVRGVAIR